MSSRPRRRATSVSFVILACATTGVALLACGEERGAASPSGALAAPEAIAIAPAHPSPDPPPAVPIIPSNDEGDADTVAIADAGAGDARGASFPAIAPASDADRVIAGLRSKFRLCYKAGLADDPKMQGRVLLSVRVSPVGAVDSVGTATVTGLSYKVVSCLEGVLRSAQFSPPGGTGATLQVPAIFKPENAP